MWIVTDWGKVAVAWGQSRSHMPNVRTLNTTLLAITACLLWSTAFVGIKAGLSYTTPINFAGTRFIIAGMMLLPFVGKWSDLLAVIQRNYGYLFAVSILSTALTYALFYWGISYSAASTTAIVIGAQPLFVAVMAHLFVPNDKLTKKKVGALIAGIVGLWIIAASRYDAADASGMAFWGVLMLIGSNLSIGYGDLLISKTKREIPPSMLSAVQLTLGGAMLFSLSLFVEGADLSWKPLPYYGALLHLSGLSAGAMTIWFTLLRRPGVKVSEINFWKFIIPVFGALISWTVIEDDHPDISQIFGMVAIAAALVLMNAGSRR
jgi:drug/metabolite transporter (DMT)-like permease